MPKFWHQMSLRSVSKIVLQEAHYSGKTLVNDNRGGGPLAIGPDSIWYTVRRVFNYAPANNTVFMRVFYSNVGGFSNPSFTAYYIDTRTTGEYAEIYTLALTPATATIEPGKTYTFTATVTKQGGGAPDGSVPVYVTVGVDPNSGGHVHGETYATRDKGSVSPASGNTSLQTTFTSTEVSGTHTITATCDLCAHKTATATATATVKVPGLEPIPDSPFYSLTEPIGGGRTKIVGATDNHQKNHFLTIDAATILGKLAKSYHTTFPLAPVLYINDASLEWGGKFDIAGNWVGEHAEHKRGTVVDLRANPNGYGTMPPENFDRFIRVAADIRTKGVPANAKIHCTQDKKGTPPSLKHNRAAASNCVSKLDGSQDNNRHFHIRLMGVAE